MIYDLGIRTSEELYQCQVQVWISGHSELGKCSKWGGSFGKDIKTQKCDIYSSYEVLEQTPKYIFFPYLNEQAVLCGK